MKRQRLAEECVLCLVNKHVSLENEKNVQKLRLFRFYIIHLCRNIILRAVNTRLNPIKRLLSVKQ